MIGLGQQGGDYLVLAANIEVGSSYKCVFFCVSALAMDPTQCYKLAESSYSGHFSQLL